MSAAASPFDNDWRERAGRILLDPNDPNGAPLATPLDRRWLWRIEGELAVSATTETLRQLGRDLHQYLAETCEHHWGASHAAEPDIPAHRQCLWCSDVDWLADGGQ